MDSTATPGHKPAMRYAWQQSDTIAAREGRVRRALARKGERLVKSRAANPELSGEFRYMIVNDRNHLIGGTDDLEALECDLWPTKAA